MLQFRKSSLAPSLPCLALVLVTLVLSLASTASSTTTPSDDISERWIRWTNLPNPDSSDDYLINVTVNGIDLGSVPIDTGSTGFLISAKSLNYNDDSSLKKHCKPAFEFLSSSRRFYEGYWLPSTLVFKSSTDRSFHSSVPVFAVTEAGNCSAWKDGQCTKDQRRLMPQGIQYMGVGFGRWSDEQPDATADKNPLLNVDFGTDDTLRSGYVVSDSGIILGLRSRDLMDDDWTLVNLTRNDDAPASSGRPEWRGVPMCVEVAGSECFQGIALFDTGINYSFLGVPPEATQDLNVTSGGLRFLKNGTDVKVKIGSHGNCATEFTFKVGDHDSIPHTAPGRVRLVRPHADGAYINTGRYFFNGFSLLFDEHSGVVGFKSYAPTGLTLQNGQSEGWRSSDQEL